MSDEPQPTDKLDPVDTGLVCLVMLARFHNVAASPEQLAHEFAPDGQVFGFTEVLLAAKKLGLKAKPARSNVERLSQTPLPSLASSKDGHFFVIARVDNDQVLIQDPRSQRPEVMSFDELKARWTGELILIRSEASLAGELAKFDFTWFIPAIIKYRKLLGEVLLVSFVLQIFALVTPLFFQVVMDKVLLVHRGLSTLDVIAVGLLVIMLFETGLSGLRSYVFSHTASRIDVELGSRLFRHLVTLPLAYFQARRVIHRQVIERSSRLRSVATMAALDYRRMSVAVLQKPLSRHMRSLGRLRRISQIHPRDGRSLRQIANIQRANLE